ncbi:hypothetical protein C7212DRAFT_361344 [Tuber magnatum]|uniref:Uncharacterized protein n=1 Tax=Tuber magnatum TaxID=42249 RepID=A0A317T2D3_9PEZI|nr:hypothetical protein C7212DRAFT_361344 [Tuber magnatum]
MSGLDTQIIIFSDGPRNKANKIRGALRDLFGEEARVKGIADPIDQAQAREFLRFVVPEIEGAYDLRVYTTLEELRQTEKTLQKTQSMHQQAQEGLLRTQLSLQRTEEKLEKSEKLLRHTIDTRERALEEIRSLFAKFSVNPESTIRGILGG